MNTLRNAWPVLVLVLASISLSANADLAEVAVVSSGETEFVSGYVLQGSRNMKKLGKRSTTSPVVVPKLFLESDNVPETVLPPLATTELQPKPRFGYGSDWTPGKSYQASASPVRTFLSAPQSPSYFFRAPYTTTEYVPFYFFGNDFGCSSWSHSRHHFSFRFSH